MAGRRGSAATERSDGKTPERQGPALRAAPRETHPVVSAVGLRNG